MVKIEDLVGMWYCYFFDLYFVCWCGVWCDVCVVGWIVW